MKTISSVCILMLLATSPTRSSEIEWNRIVKSDSTERASYDIRYPSFAIPRVDPCNDSIRRFVNDAVESFRLKVNEANTVFANVSDRPSSELIVDADSTYANDSVLSCTISVSYYTVGGAHGFQDYRAFVYDRRRRRLLRPSEFLVTPESLLRRLISDSLAARGRCYDETLLGKTSLDKLHVSLCESGVLFSFSDYQIASYVCAPGQIVFGWQSIKVQMR